LSSCDTCTGRRTIKFLESATAHLHVRLLPDGVRYYPTTSFLTFVGLYCFFFLHQLTIDYFKRLNMSTVGNNTAGASGTDPISGYNLKLSRLFIMFVLFLYRLRVNTNNFYATIILLLLNNNMLFLLNFKIKIYRKITKHLTIAPASSSHHTHIHAAP
jgi:hypothetical protein